MSRQCLYPLFMLCMLSLHAYSQARIESEYKLSVSPDDVVSLEAYLEKEFKEGAYQADAIQLTIDKAEELFVDCYFDDDQNQLLNQNVGVRHRLRYSQGDLINELIQVKLPASTDGVIREEIKYTVPTRIKAVDKISRHPVLQFVDAADRDRFTYQLRRLGVDAKQLKQELRLNQIRSRVYIADEQGSVATLSLDHVKNKKIPFQEFYELEIEINEIRYTQADVEEKEYLETINEEIKQKILIRFPNLSVDQTPKYNKLHTLIANSRVSWIADHGMWFVYGIIILLAGTKLVLV